jgi:hypothetical protein
VKERKMKQKLMKQQRLFEDPAPEFLPQLPMTVQHEVEKLILQWILSLVKEITEEVRDEQNKR